MKKQVTNRILSFVLTVVMVLGMMPMSSFTAVAEEIPTEKSIMLGASHIEGAQASNVYFGQYQQSSDGNGDYNFDPIKWRVLSNADGELFLLSDPNLDVFEYHKENEAVTWETSTMRSWLNRLANNKGNGENAIDYTNDNFLDTAFSASEQTAIADTAVENYDNPTYETDGGNHTTDKVFLLSIEEAQNTAYGFTNTDTRKATNTAYVADGGKRGTIGMRDVGETDFWWLRSIGGGTGNAVLVTNSGDVLVYGMSVDHIIYTVRPAFNLSLNSVLFTSAANGGKPQGFHAVEEYTGNEYKLTLLDGRRNFAVSDTTAKTVKTGDTLSLGYTGATTDANEYISAMIADENDEILYYGTLASVTSNSGTVEFTVPSDIAAGTYTLKLLNEQINGDYKTDYASDFVDIALTVETSAPEVPANAVAQVTTEDGATTKFYTDFDSASADAKANPGSTLKLLNNIVSSTTGFYIDGTFTIDLNGFRITADHYALQIERGDITITDTSEGQTGGVFIEIEGEPNPTIEYAAINVPAGYNAHVTIEKGTYSADFPGGIAVNAMMNEVTIKGGNFIGNIAANYQATIDIHNGSFSCKENPYLLFAGNEANVTVFDGTFTYEGIREVMRVYGGTLTVSGGTIESSSYDINYSRGVLDLSNHRDPTGITIYNTSGTAVTVGDTVKLPMRYVMLDGDGNAVGSLAADESCTVEKAQDTYTVTLVPNGGTIANGKDVTQYAYGVGETLPNQYGITREGHDFAGWYENENFSGSAVTRISETDVGNKTYYAKWEVLQYSVTFHAGEGTFASGRKEITIDVYFGTVPTVPEIPALAGYTFAHWDPALAPVTVEGATYWAQFCDHSCNINTPTDAGDGKHSFTCSSCSNSVTEDHTKVYSVNQDTSTITASCDICHSACGSATLKVPEYAYYTNSSVFSAGYGSSFENGEEVKLTYDGGSSTAPSSLGEHTATLTVYEGGEVKASVSATYEITYLPTPQNAYNVSGGYQAGDTHWFKEGETVTVTAPSGYKVSKELNGNYGSSVSFSQGDDMVIYLKDEDGAMTDGIHVTGVRFDGSAPTGRITVTEQNFWEKLLNKITFGLFFKEEVAAAVTYSDTDSGVKSVEYYVASEDLIADEALHNAAAAAKLENAVGGNWKTYSAEIPLNRNDKNVVYVKITDNVGNVTYVSSEGVVLDSIAPDIRGLENGGVYYGTKIFKAMDDNFLKIELDGVDITNTTEGDDEFKIVADNAEHTVTVTDKAGNVTEYTITVYKRYIVTFTDGEGGSYEKEFKYGEVITIPANEFFEDTFRKTGYTLTEWQGYTEGMTMPLENLTFTATYTPNDYTVAFDTNGGGALAPITVTFGEKYGSLPSSSVAGLSGGNKNWYLVDANGNVTETNIKNLTLVSMARDHVLFIKRNVLAPNVSIALTVPGGISDGYQYYIPGASQRVLTATVNNANTELLSYTYQWYKDGAPMEGATASVLTLDGNVADSGTYKVEVTATLKDGMGIVVTTSSATGSKEQKVKILHAANTLNYDANGGVGGPQNAFSGGTSLNVSTDMPTREHYDFIGWNTKADGSGDSYKAKDAYTFTSDGGNGGCTVTLYAQWKPKEYTVTFKADGEVVIALEVEYGEDVAFPEVPKKDGYVGKWDWNNENITSDTVINAVYTEIGNFVPDEFKMDDKTELQDVKKQLEDMLDDDGYTEDDKKAIQDAIDDIEDALEAIGNVEATEELIDKLPDTIRKDDEAAIKAADDAYNALSDYEKSLVGEDAKKALEDAKAALAELNKPIVPNAPATGDNSNPWLWFALLFVSGGAMITLAVYDKKRRSAANK